MSEKPVDINKLSYEEVKDLLNGLDDAKNQNLEKIKSVAKEESVFYNPSNYGSYKKALETNLEKCVAFYEKVRKLLDEASGKFYKKDENGFPVDENFLSKLVVINANPGGSTGAKIVQAPDGTKFVMKRPSNKGGYPHLKNEYDANQFYSSMGATVPESKLFENSNDQNDSVLLSKFVENGMSLGDWRRANQNNPRELNEMKKKLRKHYAVDILLGNWDVVGQSADNILIDSNGTPYRIDNGGSMGFRAQGYKKQKNDWNPDDNFDVKKQDWKQSAYFDDLWTMTGNGARIGLSVGSDIPKYFGDCDVFEIVEEIHSKDWTKALQLLSEKDQWAINLRLEEARQLYERGNRYVKIEDMSVFPRETMLKVLDYTYKMSKDGFRYVISQQPTPSSISGYDPSNVGWFNMAGNSPQELGSAPNKKQTFDYIGDYLAYLMGRVPYDFIQETNKSQAADSFDYESCLKKIYIARNNGIDIKKIGKKKDKDNGNFDEFLKKCNNEGYFTGIKSYQISNMNNAMGEVWKKDKAEVQRLCNAFLMNDAAMQLILENTPVVGVDGDTGTIILIRTEHGDILRDANGAKVNEGERSYHSSGFCESHSHMRAVAPFNPNVTAVRVPFSRIHGFWFIQRHSPNKSLNINEDTMFLGSGENEITADTHGLIKVYLGNIADYKTSSKVKTGLEKYEKSPSGESILTKLR